MYDHVGLTVSDLERSRAFYAAALAPLGITELVRHDNFIGFGREHPQFWIGAGAPAQPSPRTHVAFSAVTRLEVDAFWHAAIAKGGSDHAKGLFFRGAAALPFGREIRSVRELMDYLLTGAQPVPRPA